MNRTIRIALTLLMAVLTTFTVQATDFITEVMLIGHADKTEFNNLLNTYKNQGWKVIDYDLNKGCGTGSAYINLLYKSESNSDGFNHGYITDFYIKTGKNPPGSLTYDGRTYQRVSCKGSSDFVNGYGDLNDGCGSGSEYIYLFYTKGTFSDNRAVTSIYFNDTQSGAVGANGGSTGYDLNKGCGSETPYIYMHFTTGTAVPPMSGSGTTESPYIIGSTADWTKFVTYIGDGLNTDKCYKLIANISVTTMAGTSGQPFKGTFDGGGKTLTFNLSGSEQGMAPFHYINGATIKNLTIGGSVSSTNKHAAGLVGFCSGGTNTIDGCVVTANVDGGGSNYAGGFVGHGKSSTLTIQNSYYSGTISNFSYLAGGLLGWSDDMTINLSNCLFKGSFSPASGGRYHPIACTYNATVVTATASKNYYLNTVTPTAPENKIIPEAAGIAVSTTFDIDNWNTPITAVDGITYYGFNIPSVVTIGDGTRADYFTPFENDKNYSLSQQIYTAEEIGMAGTISSIVFRWNQSFSLEGVQVYLKHTEKTEFINEDDIVPFSASDKVFEGTYAASEAGWATIKLDMPFEYDGNSNLLVCCSDPTDGSPGSDLRCYEHNTDKHLVLWYFSDYYVPNIENLSGYRGNKAIYKSRNNIQLQIIPAIFAHPANLHVSSCTEEKATLTWEAPETNETITGYAYQYKKDSDAQWSNEVTLNSTTTSATISVTAATDYQFRVRALYGDRYSSYALLRFTSAVTLPYECGFEDGMDGWSVVNLDWNKGGGIKADAAHDGEYGFSFGSTSNPPQYLISPRLSGTEDIMVTFYYLGWLGKFQVGYSTTTNDISAFTWREVQEADPVGTWIFSEKYCPVGTTYIAIKYDFKSSVLYLDDFYFSTYSHERPDHLAVSDLTDQSAKLTWTKPVTNETVTGYAYQYKKENETAWSNEATVNTLSVTLNGLSPNTTYRFRVKAIYDDGTASSFTAVSFLTEGSIVKKLPYEYGFEDGMSSWRILNAGPRTGLLSDDQKYIHQGSQSFYFYPNPNSTSPQYLFSPQFDVSTPMIVSFYYKNYSDENDSYPAKFQVGYSSTSKNPTDFTWEPETRSSAEWKEYNIFVPEGTKYVAIKWINSNPLYLDDFSFTESVVPAIPSQLTATNLTTTSADLSWTGNTETYQVRYRTAPLFFENFENGISEWKIVNQGGTANTNWQLEYIEIDKNHYAGVASYDETTEEFYTVDNWLISPQVNLGGTLKYMTAQTIEYPVHYEVLVSTTSNDISAFTKIAAPEAPNRDEFVEVSLDLSSYPGKKGYVAFRLNEKAENQGANLGIDNVGIYPDNYSTLWKFIETTGESTTVTGLQPFTPYKYNVRARINNYYSSWSEDATFTTNDIIPLADNADNTEAIAAIADNKTHDVMLQGRTLWKDNDWNTLCLPFGVESFTGTPLEGATVKTLVSATFSNGTLTMNFSDDLTSIEAGKPYIVKWAETTPNYVENPVFNGVTVTSTSPTDVTSEAANFHGIFNPFSTGGEDKTMLYLGADKTLYYPTSDMTINAFRAYFTLNGITAGDASGDVSIKAFVLNFGEETGINEISKESRSLGVADGWYSLDGRRLGSKPADAGLYIHNGRKVLIK